MSKLISTANKNAAGIFAYPALLQAMLVVFAVLVGLLVFAGQGRAQFQQVGTPELSPWKYRWGDSPFDAQGIPVWTYQEASDSSWIPGETFSAGDGERQRYIWVRFTLPAQEVVDPAIVVHELPLVFELYLEQEKLYASAEMTPDFDSHLEFYRVHIIPLPSEAYQGRSLFFRFYTPNPEKIFQEKYVSKIGITFASQAQLTTERLKQEILQFMLGCLFILVGAAAVFLFLKRYKQRLALALAFGISTIAAGIFLTTNDIVVLKFLLDMPPTWSFLKLPALYLFPVGILAFSEQIAISRYRPVMRRLWQIHLVYAIGAFLLDLGNILFLWQIPEENFYILAGLTLLVSTGIVGKSASQGDREARILTIGYLITEVFIVRDLLRGLGIISHWPEWYQYPWFPFGLCGLILSLLYLLEYRFTQAEKALHETMKARQEKKIAQAANEAKSQFLSNMSHELRTPLNAILGYTQILKRDTALTEKQQKAVHTIHRSSERLLSLIEEVLDLAKIEARKLELVPVIFHLSELLHNIVDMLRIQAEQKRIVLNCEFSPDLPNVVRGDEKRLWQILLNLLGNAIKFTDVGGTVRFTVSDRSDKPNRPDRSDRVGVEKKPTPPPSQDGNREWLRFVVQDTGIGIPQEHIEQIFHPFEQVGEHRYKATGTGLGLAICQQLVRLMGGELCVKSVSGQGSTFWFDILLPCVAEGMETERRFSPANDLPEQGEMYQNPERGTENIVVPPQETLAALRDMQSSAILAASGNCWTSFRSKIQHISRLSRKYMNSRNDSASKRWLSLLSRLWPE